jgi:hypothetical protein
MALRGEVLPVGGAARVPDQGPGRRGSRGPTPVLASRIMTLSIERIAVAAGSRPMAHEAPRCTSTTRGTGLHDAIDWTLDRILARNASTPVPGMYQNVPPAHAARGPRNAPSRSETQAAGLFVQPSQNRLRRRSGGMSPCPGPLGRGQAATVPVAWCGTGSSRPRSRRSSAYAVIAS